MAKSTTAASEPQEGSATALAEASRTRKTRDPEAQAIDEINTAMARLGEVEKRAITSWFIRKHVRIAPAEGTAAAAAAKIHDGLDPFAPA